MIDLAKAHEHFKKLVENKDFDINGNLDLLLNNQNNLENEEIVARYVINMLSIKDIIVENKENLTNSKFMLQVCKNYPFLSSIEGEQFVYVAKGVMPEKMA